MVFGHVHSGEDLEAGPEHAGEVTFQCLDIPLEELVEVVGEREVWASLLKVLPLRPSPTDRLKKMNRKPCIGFGALYNVILYVRSKVHMGSTMCETISCYRNKDLEAIV